MCFWTCRVNSILQWTCTSKNIDILEYALSVIFSPDRNTETRTYFIIFECNFIDFNNSNQVMERFARRLFVWLNKIQDITILP